jgi:uncharacterized repeat protein (TIGR01451 family)
MKTRNSTVFAALLFIWPVWAARSAEFSYQFGMPTNLIVGSNFTTTLTLTNTSAIQVFDVRAVFAFSSGIQFVSGSNATVTGNQVSFSIASLPNNPQTGVTNLSFVVRPLFAGPLTNALTISATGFQTTNASIVGSVFTLGDLGVSVDVPAPVIVGDDTSYSITITNASGGTLSDITISNSLPTNTIFRGLSPTNGTVANINSSVLISNATVPGATSFTYRVFIQPNSTGQLAFSTAASSSSLFDTNTDNDLAQAFLTVFQPDTNQFSIGLSEQLLNHQTGLYNQTVHLVNTGSVAVASARVIVVGLTNANQLYNASGTNSGHPFVVYPAAIDPGASADLVLEFYYPSRRPQTNLTYIVYGVAEPDLHTTTNGVTIITLITNYPGNLMLLEFQSVPGKSYRIVYSSEVNFTNPLMAVPLIVAPANRTQWIDEGPPKTISKPNMRFYRVLEQ